MKTGRYMMTKLQTTSPEIKVYIIENRPKEPAKEPELDVLQVETDNYYPQIEYIGDTSSDEEGPKEPTKEQEANDLHPDETELSGGTDTDEEMPELEDVTDENRDEIEAQVKAYREARGTESAEIQMRTFMRRHMGPTEAYRSFYANDLSYMPWPSLTAIDERNMATYSHWRQRPTPIVMCEGGPGTVQNPPRIKKKRDKK